jgi:hypothetical protein
MANKGLVAVFMIVVSILFAIVGYFFAFSGIFSGNSNVAILILIGFGFLVGSFIVGILGILLGLFRFVKWAIKD